MSTACLGARVSFARFYGTELEFAVSRQGAGTCWDSSLDGTCSRNHTVEVGREGLRSTVERSEPVSHILLDQRYDLPSPFLLFGEILNFRDVSSRCSTQDAIVS